MKKTGKPLCIALSLAALAWLSVAPAQASDLIDVRADVEGVFPGPGGGIVAQLEWGVLNLSHETSLSVVLNAYIVYSNGVRQQVFPAEHVVLGPAGGVIKLGFVIIPRAAASGPAIFHVDGRVGRVNIPSLGGSGGADSDTDLFVVP